MWVKDTLSLGMHQVLCFPFQLTEEESEEEAPPPKKTPAKAKPAKAAPVKAEESDDDDDDDGMTCSSVHIRGEKNQCFWPFQQGDCVI